MTRRIGLFGGSFDPVHVAHLALARAALAQLALDELRWVPAGQAWQKTRAMTPAVHREAMLRLAIADEPRWRLERCELQRSGPSYTVDTVRELQAAEPGASWFLVIGQDQYAGLHTWHRFDELLRLVTLAVALRPGAAAEADPRVRAAPLLRIELPPMAVSATAIRARVAAGEGIAGLVPPAVADYIYRHRLYRSAPGS
ncbi:MAG: nicotinate-nucleotide adenylyltransferase [Burkholderiales bacterium]|nr:nicotinate-nucleotide adenylyltransferase [Burkholderiales bacterium]